jgi:hypothetical protein
MSWIQENKFVAGLTGVTAVLGGAILFFGVSQRGNYNKKLEKFEELKGQYASLEKLKPYPSAKNLRKREHGIDDYETTISEVRDLVESFSPEKLESLSPEQFKDIRVKLVDDLSQKCSDSKTKYPDDCLFGFERYATSSVKAKATPKLGYELKAIHWLISKLAESKADAILNIRRAELPEEHGAVSDVRAMPRRGGRSQGRKRVASQEGRDVYELMPMELTFTANEDSVRQFLMEMVNSKEYYYAIRGLRIRNEKQIAPNQKDANFPVESTAGSDDSFGSLEGLLNDSALGDEEMKDESEEDSKKADATEEEAVKEEESPSTSAIPDGELILKQVLGGEKLNVHIRFDIVLIERKSEDSKPSASNRTRKKR